MVVVDDEEEFHADVLFDFGLGAAPRVGNSSGSTKTPGLISALEGREARSCCPCDDHPDRPSLEGECSSMVKGPDDDMRLMGEEVEGRGLRGEAVGVGMGLEGAESTHMLIKSTSSSSSSSSSSSCCCRSGSAVIVAIGGGDEATEVGKINDG